MSDMNKSDVVNVPIVNVPVVIDVPPLYTTELSVNSSIMQMARISTDKLVEYIHTFLMKNIEKQDYSNEYIIGREHFAKIKKILDPIVSPTHTIVDYRSGNTINDHIIKSIYGVGIETQRMKTYNDKTEFVKLVTDLYTQKYGETIKITCHYKNHRLKYTGDMCDNVLSCTGKTIHSVYNLVVGVITLPFSTWYVCANDDIKYFYKLTSCGSNDGHCGTDSCKIKCVGKDCQQLYLNRCVVNISVNKNNKIIK